jgi:multisubunit Na+/H+ antiporter MnhE subunit
MVAGAIGFCVTLVALRLGGVSSVFARMPRLLGLSLQQTGAALGGGWRTLRAALAADVTLAPALVRVKTRLARGDEQASLVSALSVAPGMVVVDADSDGLLVHVMNEGEVDAAELGRIEYALASDRRP